MLGCTEFPIMGTIRHPARRVPMRIEKNGFLCTQVVKYSLLTAALRGL